MVLLHLFEFIFRKLTRFEENEFLGVRVAYTEAVLYIAAFAFNEVSEHFENASCSRAFIQDVFVVSSDKLLSALVDLHRVVSAVIIFSFGHHLILHVVFLGFVAVVPAVLLIFLVQTVGQVARIVIWVDLKWRLALLPQASELTQPALRTVLFVLPQVVGSDPDGN
jgi:hypothetical protein